MPELSRRTLLCGVGGLIGNGAVAGGVVGAAPRRSRGAAGSTTYEQGAKLAADDGESRDRFGDDVALTDGTALVGAPSDVNPEGERAGSAYLFERTDGAWRQRTKLTGTDGQQLDDFGGAVALSDDTALVGVPGDTEPNGVDGGTVRVFERTSDGWTETATLFATDGDSEDRFGGAVALADGTALVGADVDEDPNGDGAGSAYVFERASDGWEEVAKLVPDDGDAEDWFGGAVALDDGVALVGASDDEDPNGDGAGSAYVFERTDGGWTQRAKLTADDGDTNDGFGTAVALADGAALIGAPLDAEPNGVIDGAVYAFDRAGGDWSRRAKFAPEDGGSEDLFGVSLAMTPGAAVVGASIDADPNGERAGSAFTFERTDGGWRQRAKLLPEDGDDRDQFGHAVGLAGDTALVGALLDEDPNGSDAGSAYLFADALTPAAPSTSTPAGGDPTTATPDEASPTPVTPTASPAGADSPTPVTPTPDDGSEPTPTASPTASPTAADPDDGTGGDGEDGTGGESEGEDAATTGSGPGPGLGGTVVALAAAVGLGWWQREE